MNDTVTNAGLEIGRLTPRRRYLDWLRGVAVLVMVLAHTTDAWTQPGDRTGLAYRLALFIGGFGAPAFLFVAGITLALAADARTRHGGRWAATSAAAKRGLQLFALAFVFELQSWIVSGGELLRKMTRVDILHVMGLSMCVAAVMWSCGRTTKTRAAVLLAATAAAAFVTPIVFSAEIWQLLPGPVSWYFQPAPGRSVFTVFPWIGFLLAGAVVGLWLSTSTVPRESWVLTKVVWIGAALALAGYATSWLPPLYPVTRFWTSSPAFFFLRLGLLCVGLGVAYVCQSQSGVSRTLERLGAASLFVYWIHVEMVYGLPSLLIHGAVPFGYGLVAWAMLCCGLAGLVELKRRMTQPGLPISRTAEIEPSSAIT